MIKLLAVGLGGFIGSILRYLIYQIVDKQWITHYPLSTFIVNILGSFILGILYSYILKRGLFSEEVYLLLAVGLCGSFTTFSTFSLDSLQLIQGGNYFTFIMYGCLSIFIGIIAVWFGAWIAS